ncbi:hypothetical protein [Thermocrinis sp.]
MRKIDTRNDKVLAFLLGITYGYRGALVEVKRRDISQYDEEEHSKDRVYFLNRKTGYVGNIKPSEFTHICAIRECKEEQKVIIFLYK